MKKFFIIMTDDKDEIIRDCLELLHNVRINMTNTEYNRLVDICKKVKGVYENERKERNS